MPTVIRSPEDDLEFQRAAIERALRHGWASPEDGRPRVLTERAYAEARKLLGHGGWTGLDQATIQAVRNGALPGDPLRRRRIPCPWWCRRHLDDVGSLAPACAVSISSPGQPASSPRRSRHRL